MPACAQHSERPATYRCDGCQRFLCETCIDESYRLLLCTVCGERALPLDGGQPADVRQLERSRTVSTPYSVGQAFGYPFRGTGLYIFIAAILVVFLRTYGGLMALIAMSALIAALQFHIVRCTVRGDDELEDWPDFTAWADLAPDLFAWILLEGSLQLLLGLYIGAGVLSGVLGFEPSLPMALLVAAILWLGSAFQLMGYGAAGSYNLIHLFMVHRHVQAYRQTLGDALRFTNIVFGLRGLVFVVQGLLAFIPIAGGIASGLITVYWIFLVPHFSGLLFRRHETALDDLYLSRR